MTPEYKIVFHDGPMKRKCGSCQLCCKLMPLGGDQRRSYAAALSMIEYGKAKPQDFGRMWNCRWLVEDAGETSRPDRAHYVIDFMPDVIRITPDGGEPMQFQAQEKGRFS